MDRERTAGLRQGILQYCMYTFSFRALSVLQLDMELSPELLLSNTERNDIAASQFKAQWRDDINDVSW